MSIALSGTSPSPTGFRRHRATIAEAFGNGDDLPPLKRAGPDPEYGVYVIGRPVMLVLWCIALWGTAVGARLVWIVLSQGSAAAIRFLWIPAVWLPIVLAVLMWAALLVAVRRSRGGGEP